MAVGLFFRWIKIFFVVALIFSSSTVKADPLDNWHWSSPYPTGHGFSDIIFASGKFIAVGGGGTILTSTDGISWTTANSGTTVDFGRIIYANGIFVAFGSDGRVFSSPDGDKWEYSSLIPDGPGPIEYGNGIIVAPRPSNSCICEFDPCPPCPELIPYTVHTSTDAIHWTATVKNSTDYGYPNITGFTYGNGLFLIVTPEEISSSSDGVNWQGYPNSMGIREMFYCNDMFIGRNDSSLLRSADGINWGQVIFDNSFQLQKLSCINDTVVAVGQLMIFGGRVPMRKVILTSSDGVVWSEGMFSSDNWLGLVAYGNGTYVAAGAPGIIRVSGDGRDWTDVGRRISGWPRAGVYGNGVYVVVGFDGVPGKFGGIINTSADLINWTSRLSVRVPALNAVAYDSRMFIAVGDEGIVLTSDDGLVWVRRDSGTTERLIDILYANGLFVAVSPANSVITSPDGLEWRSGAQRETSAPDYSRRAAYGNNAFVVAGSGCIDLSYDGLMWTRVLSLDPSIFTFASVQPYGACRHTYTRDFGLAGITGAAFGKDSFVVVSRGGRVLTSPDGCQWNINSSPYPFRDVVFARDVFVGVGQGGTIVSSSDGVTWAARQSPTADNLVDVFFGNNTFVAIGDNGTILRSDPVWSSCAATVSSDLTLLHLPRVSYKEMSLWGDLTLDVGADGSLIYQVANGGTADPGQFVDCQAAILSPDLKSLHIPEVVYDGKPYRADLELIPSSDGAVRMKLVSAAPY